MTFLLHRRSIVGLAAIAWIYFCVLVIGPQSDDLLRNVLGFLSLTLLPGFLTLLALRLRLDSFWGYVGLCLGFSLFELMSVGLIGNTLLPFIGLMHPLSSAVLLFEVSLLIAILLLINWFEAGELTLEITPYELRDNVRNGLYAFIPILFVPLSILGAIRLNNGASGTLTLLMLIGIGIYALALVSERQKLDHNVIPTALFFLSLSLLFMTSLRGWYVTGHDIQREYLVFELAKSAGWWTISSYHDAYNACMSITILPSIMSALLSISDPYIYKVLFQIIFATVPSIVYLTFCRYVSPTVAFISTFYFISLPTILGDMPFLNRQEIAFLFLALITYLLFDDSLSQKMRSALSIVLGFGLVLSHYSTTYIAIALFSFVVVTRPLLRLVARYFRTYRLFSDSGVDCAQVRAPQARVTALFLVSLCAATFLWSSVLTDTSSNSLSRVFRETIAVIQNSAQKDVRSGDVLYGLFSWRTKDIVGEFEAYREKEIAIRATLPAAELYPAFAYEKYPLVLAPQELLPLTVFGSTLSQLGVDVVTTHYLFRQITAKLLQICIILGVCAAIMRPRFFKKLVHTDFFLLSIGSIAIIASQVLLPVLSVEYGLLRAFEQSLMFLGVFVALGSMVLLVRFRESVRVGIAGIIAVIFFWSSTGVIAAVTGGYLPQLHLANGGQYYDIFYAHESENLGISWLLDTMRERGVQEFQSDGESDHYVAYGLPDSHFFFTNNDIYPGVVGKNAFVFLGYSNIVKQTVTVSYNGDLMTYTYPIDFLESNKNLLYDNGTSRVYR